MNTVPKRTPKGINWLLGSLSDPRHFQIIFFLAFISYGLIYLGWETDRHRIAHTSGLFIDSEKKICITEECGDYCPRIVYAIAG
jgi:hypothetical protein